MSDPAFYKPKDKKKQKKGYVDMKLLLEGLGNECSKPQLRDVLWKATEGGYEKFIM